MIQVENLSFHYKGKKRLFEGLRVMLQDGDCVGIVGNNGTGKSTLMKLMLAILKPQSGDVKFHGKSVKLHRKAIMKDVGVVWGQRSSLWWDLSVQSSIEQLCKMYDVDPCVMEENLAYYGSKVSLQSFWKQPLRKVSYGQRVQADLIAVLVREPKYLFLDEAFIGLDYHTKEMMISLLKDYKKTHPDCIMVVTSHAFQDLTRLCDRLLVLQEDGTCFETLMKDVLAKKVTEVVLEFTGDVVFDEEVSVEWINANKVKVLLEGEINGFMQGIDWDTVLSMEIQDRTLDFVIAELSGRK